MPLVLSVDSKSYTDLTATFQDRKIFDPENL